MPALLVYGGGVPVIVTILIFVGSIGLTVLVRMICNGGCSGTNENESPGGGAMPPPQVIGAPSHMAVNMVPQNGAYAPPMFNAPVHQAFVQAPAQNTVLPVTAIGLPAAGSSSDPSEDLKTPLLENEV